MMGVRSARVVVAGRGLVALVMRTRMMKTIARGGLVCGAVVRPG